MAQAAEQRVTKQERVYRVVRERILGGAYGPGYRFVIDTLAGEFGVSALPVREAIRRLEAEGLVVFRPNAGAQVAPADPGLFEAELTVLAILEGYATACAASRLGEVEIAQLGELNNRMEEAIGRLDPLGFSRLNQEFHSIICDYCPNPALVGLLRDVARRLDAIRRTVFVQIPYRGRESVAEHRQLLDLLAKGAPADEIEAAARRHKLQTVISFRTWQAEHPPTSKII
ncbi:GntR family transcriptional regulator [Gaiella sp.]|jgi:DNA-binding GntR family transcriptional regulator|uniref:GntR family transcriptional regulator n=1 Tax=Gaiella sp. TaxID=2663207 RepID=UPI002E32B481|nr:GntR family transcriptional regulator [Gaiella sp.]HEX5584601.1 GntR family transcriptional regulator [Gaiella sp.]